MVFRTAYHTALASLFYLFGTFLKVVVLWVLAGLFADFFSLRPVGTMLVVHGLTEATFVVISAAYTTSCMAIALIVYLFAVSWRQLRQRAPTWARAFFAGLRWTRAAIWGLLEGANTFRAQVLQPMIIICAQLTMTVVGIVFLLTAVMASRVWIAVSIRREFYRRKRERHLSHRQTSAVPISNVIVPAKAAVFSSPLPPPSTPPAPSTPTAATTSNPEDSQAARLKAKFEELEREREQQRQADAEERRRLQRALQARQRQQQAAAEKARQAQELAEAERRAQELADADRQAQESVRIPDERSRIWAELAQTSRVRTVSAQPVGINNNGNKCYMISYVIACCFLFLISESSERY
jgi:hypothetical protein